MSYNIICFSPFQISFFAKKLFQWGICDTIVRIFEICAFSHVNIFFAERKNFPENNNLVLKRNNVFKKVAHE